MQMLSFGPSISNTVAYKMKKFFMDLWACWKEIQQERARYYDEHGDCWE